MTSLDDLRAAFTLLEDAAPTELSPRPERRPPTRRPGRDLAALAAALVSVAAVVGIAVVVGHQVRPAAPAGPRPSASTSGHATVLVSGAYGETFSLEVVDPSHLCPAPPVQAGYDTGLLRPGSSSSPTTYYQPCARVKIGLVGGTTPLVGRRSVRVSINGRPGLFGAAETIDRHIGAPTLTSVIWQLTSTRWAVLQDGASANPTEHSEVALAELVDGALGALGPQLPADASTPRPFPFRLGFIPHPVGAEWGTTGAQLVAPVYDGVDIGVSTVDVVDYRSADHATTLVTTLWGPDARSGPPPAPPAGSTHVAGRGYLAYVGRNTVDLAIGPYRLRITYSGPAATHDDLVRMASSIELPTAISDHATWFTADDLAP
jgi:hypothetical protein